MLDYMLCLRNTLYGIINIGHGIDDWELEATHPNCSNTSSPTPAPAYIINILILLLKKLSKSDCKRFSFYFLFFVIS